MLHVVFRFLFVFVFALVADVLRRLVLVHPEMSSFIKLYITSEIKWTYISVERVPGPQFAAGFSGNLDSASFRLGGLASG